MERIFDIYWQKGHMSINVGRFFSTVNSKHVRKFYRSIASFCNENSKEELTGMLLAERAERKKALQELEELEELEAKIMAIRARFPGNVPLEKQVEKLDKSLDLLEEARWGT